MTKEDRTAFAVLMALPSTTDPMLLSQPEARRIGYELVGGEGTQNMLRRPDWAMTQIYWEAMGRGFLYACRSAMPDWMLQCWLIRADQWRGSLSEGERSRLLSDVWELIREIEHPIRLAIGWVDVCMGCTEEDVIEDQMKQESLELRAGILAEQFIDRRTTPMTDEEIFKDRADDLRNL